MENEPKSVLAHKVVSEYAAALHPPPNPTLYEVQFFPVGPFSHPSLAVKIPMNIFCLDQFSFNCARICVSMEFERQDWYFCLLGSVSDVP